MLKLRADLDGVLELSHRLLVTLHELGIELQPKQAHRLVGGLFGKRSWRTALAVLKADGVLDVAPADHSEDQFIKALVDCIGFAAFERFPLENFPSCTDDAQATAEVPYAICSTTTDTFMVMAKQHSCPDGRHGFITLETRSPKEAGILLGLAMLHAFAKTPALLTRSTELQIDTDADGLNVLIDTNPALCPCCTALTSFRTYATANALPIPDFLAQAHPVGPLTFFRPYADKPYWFAHHARHNTIAPASCTEATFAAEPPPRWVPHPGDPVWIADRLVADGRRPQDAKGAVMRTWLDEASHKRLTTVKTARGAVEVPTELLIPQAPKGKGGQIPHRTKAHVQNTVGAHSPDQSCTPSTAPTVTPTPPAAPPPPP